MSGLELAIERVGKRGWLIRSLSRSEFNTIKPWFCAAYPGHLGRYHEGTKVKNGLYSCYKNSMVMFTADGATALEAVNAVIAKIDASKEKRIYDDLEQAFEDTINARLQKIGDRG